ncbi:hypothetical protein ACWCZ5_30250 [Streptomyces sp. NPDC001667]
MSRWDADLQQWVDDDPPPRRPHHHGPHEPTEPDILLGPVPPDDLATGPSHAAILAGVLAGVVLAGGIGVGIWELTRDDGGGSTPGGGVPSAPTAPVTPGPSYDGSTVTGGLTGGLTGGPTYAPPTDLPTGQSTYDSPSPYTGTGTGSAPAGYARTKDPSGFTLDVPQGWQRSTDGTSVYYRTADDESFIQVFVLHGPEATPYDAIVSTEASMSKNPGYHRVRMERTAGGAAELEYTYTRDDGSPRHVALHDLLAPDRQQYGLLVAGPAGDWGSYEGVFRTLLSSFCPTAYCTNGG